MHKKDASNRSITAGAGKLLFHIIWWANKKRGKSRGKLKLKTAKSQKQTTWSDKRINIKWKVENAGSMEGKKQNYETSHNFALVSSDNKSPDLCELSKWLRPNRINFTLA